MRILIISQYFYPENFPINNFLFELGKSKYDIIILTCLPNYRNKGLGKESLDLLTGYAFNTLNLKQLNCTVLKKNNLSKKLFISSDFKLES